MQFYKIAGDPLDFTGTHSIHVDAAGETSGHYDADYVRGAVATTYADKAEVELDSPVPLDDPIGVWVHVAVRNPRDADYGYDEMEHVFSAYDSNGDYLARSAALDNAHLQLELYASDGSSASSADVEKGAWAVDLTTFDVHFFTDADGKGHVDFYNGGFFVLGAETATPLGDLKSVGFGTGYDYKPTYYSEGIISDSDTRQMRVKSFYPSADGTYTDGGVDGYQLVDGTDLDGTTLDLASAGDRHSFSLAGASDAPIMGVVGLSISAHVASGVGHDVEVGLRVGGNDVYGAALGPTTDMLPRGLVWSVDMPGGDLLPQDLGSVELLVKAV